MEFKANFKTNFKCGEFRQKFIDKMVRTGKFYRNKNGVVLSKEYPKHEKNNLDHSNYSSKNFKDRKRSHYTVVEKLCEKYYPSPINTMEAGGATGYFAKMYINRFHPKTYVIYEQSKDMNKRSKKKFRDYKSTKVNIKMKSFKNIPVEEIKEYDCVISLEVLEHINWDKEFLSSLSPSTWIFLSVPRIHDSTHVRAYLTPDSISYRYKDILNIYEIREVRRIIHFKSKHNYPLIWGVASQRK